MPILRQGQGRFPKEPKRYGSPSSIFSPSGMRGVASLSNSATTIHRFGQETDSAHTRHTTPAFVEAEGLFLAYYKLESLQGRIGQRHY